MALKIKYMNYFKDLINITKNKINQDKDDFNFENKLELINEIEKCIENNLDILWHPSSHNNFENLIYFNNNRLDFLENNSPILFIHNDISSEEYIDLYPERTYFKSFAYGNDYFSTTINLQNENEFKSKSITLSKFRSGANNYKFKINLFGFSNNEILGILIKSKINIKYLYTTFTNEQAANIEPHYYFYFYNILNIKFHIGTDLDNFNDIENQKKYITDFINSQSIVVKKNLLLNINENIVEIIKKYNIIKINTNDKIRFISNGFEHLKCRFIN
jgi:hypothetical protein